MDIQPEFYVHQPHPFLWEFPGGGWGIRFYGIAYVLGFVTAGVLLHLYWKFRRSPMGPGVQADLLFNGMVGTLVGGRLGFFLFYELGTLLDDPLVLFRVWEGGMASHGGFLGVFLGIWWTAHKHHLPITRIGDLVVTLGPPGLMFGRLANYINGELWGKATTVPWAVIFTNSDPGEPNPAFITPRHPSQLYEAALEGLLLLVYTQWRIWRTPAVLDRPGRLSGEFLLGYALARIFCEHFREPDATVAPFLGFNRGAWLSLALLAAGAGLIAYSMLRPKATDPKTS